MTNLTTASKSRGARALALSAVLVGGMFCLPATPAAAQSEKSSPEELLEEGTRRILRAFELFIQTIPQYEMPEVLPNGDIIIRRIPPEPDPEREPEPAPETAPDDDGTRI